MRALRNYYQYNLNSIAISKLMFDFFTLPELRQIVCFFVISIKEYKKNLLLFYIILCLVFGSIQELKKKILKGRIALRWAINHQKINFLYSFVNFYLPILDKNSIKYGSFCLHSHKKTTLQTYRCNFHKFPVIPELDLIYEEHAAIYSYVSNYKLQLDFIVNETSRYRFGGTIIRMYRFPAIFKGKK